MMLDLDIEEDVLSRVPSAVSKSGIIQLEQSWAPGPRTSGTGGPHHMLHDKHRRSPSGASLFGIIVVSFWFPSTSADSRNCIAPRSRMAVRQALPKSGMALPSLAHEGAQARDAGVAGRVTPNPLAAVSALAVNTVSAHYIFQQFTAGTTKFDVFQYVRKNSNYNSPVTDLASNDLRCNVGATGSGTDTIAMTAGETFSFTLDTAVYHQGPISIYLSKAPGAASAYVGDGEWFKIKDFGNSPRGKSVYALSLTDHEAPTFSGGSATWPLAQTYTYQLPKCIENGEYLLRIQSLAIHNPWPAGIPQFYISCAQIEVTGGSGSANPTHVLIPGAFKATDPGYTANIYTNFNNYTVPGPTPSRSSEG
ncbi:hypothetical protein CIB48_g7939 [Xylaria polymorpha]|nr:hypothetical protein CIB48_g7939 [Xylaria polymorpha]